MQDDGLDFAGTGGKCWWEEHWSSPAVSGGSSHIPEDGDTLSATNAHELWCDMSWLTVVTSWAFFGGESQIAGSGQASSAQDDFKMNWSPQSGKELGRIFLNLTDEVTRFDLNEELTRSRFPASPDFPYAMCLSVPRVGA